MKSFEINIEPEILVWARESIGQTIDDIAKKLKVNRTDVVEWEKGQKNPRLAQVEKLANLYKRPLAAFFLPEPPKEIPLPKDYRTLPIESRKTFSSKTLLAIRRAERVQRTAIELAESVEKPVSTKVIRASLNDDIEALALKARMHLGVTIKDQFNWKDEKDALDEWRRVVEKKDILVLRANMPIEDTRGFSLFKKEYPVIVLNSNDSYTARIFSLFHEHAHLMLNNAGICDMADRFYLSEDDRKMERFCNFFAGAFLVPKQDLLNHNLVRSLKTISIPDEILKEIAGDFKVSPEVILRRLVINGFSTESYYAQKKEEWAKKLKEDDKAKKWGRKIPANSCIQENGVSFVSLVLTAYNADKITFSDVSDYLGIKLKHLSKVANLISEKAL